ncbi:MAG TPA: hypothetical protein VJZ00_19765 [Thermoanaerobaculia bacterium]|nr:hypothetical protein [Thermoanaerobaculia bacterium]
MNERRELWMSGAFATWGLTIAIALISVWTRPAPAGQLPGVATALNYDAHGPFRWILGLMLLPIVLPLALRTIARHLAAGRTWARHSVIVAVLVTLWIITTYRNVALAIIPCAIVIAICALLRDRDLAFTRADVVLVPTFVTTFLAIIDIGGFSVNGAVLIAALIVFIVRVAAGNAYAFVFAPLALILQTNFFARDQRYFGWHALAIVVITPIVMRFFVHARFRKTLVLFVFPLALYAYANAMSRETAEGKPRADFFEDGHSLLPASEYLRGERPYVDVLPAHGLGEDGGFDALAMRVLGPDIGARWRARLVVGNLLSCALYALAFAVTGSAEGAFLAVLLSILTGAYTMHIRMILPVVALTLALRRRWLLAGIVTVVACVISLDFGVFTFVTLLVAAFRVRALRPLLTGLAASALVLFVLFAVFGILGPFFVSTFADTPSVAAAYTLQMFSPPDLMKAFPDVLSVALEPAVFLYLAWCVVAIATALLIARHPRRRFEPVLLLGIWIVLSAISYAERHHLRFGVLVSILIVWLAVRYRRFAIPIAIAAIALAQPTTHLAVVGWMRQSRGPIEPGWVAIDNLPRARGVWFSEKDAAVIASTQKYVTLALKPDETFFDFTNSGILYFLTRRDCPVREYEVAFYETEAKQHEVIRRRESNPKIRAAMVSQAPRFTVDGVANAARAPLVWQYLEQHFEPDFEEGDVVFWRRK